MISRWTPERDEQLARLAADKLSAGRIAAALGPDFTRNMVISRAGRIGVSLGSVRGPSRKPRPRAKPVITLTDGSQKPQVPLQNGNVARWAKTRGAPRKPASSVEVPATESPAPGAVTLMALRFPVSQCRWIDGEPAGTATVYCGAPVQEASAYCPEYASRCYQPRVVRRYAGRGVAA
jgi:hypothetical protein